jgi:putative hydrolase of the HAD superfamily
VVKAILFDLGNTLVQFWACPEFPTVLREAITEVQNLLRGKGLLRVSPEVMWERVEEHNHELPGHRVYPLKERLSCIFEVTTEELLAAMCRQFMKPISARGRVYPDTPSTLDVLRARGYRTAIISNTPWGSPAELWREQIEHLGLRERVDVDVFCDDVGWRKPAPQIFEHVLERLGVEAGQCLFVGDDPRWDLVGPRALGMKALLIDRSGEMQDAQESPIRNLHQLLEWLPLLYELRAATDADYRFLYDLHVATLRAYVEQTWGWDEAYQKAYFQEHFEPARRRVIVVDGQDVGVLQVKRTEAEVVLQNIRIAPAWQRRGLGTAIIQDILAQAQRDGLPVALRVLKVNPAKRLYERLGFVVIGETPTHYKMRAEPEAV